MKSAEEFLRAELRSIRYIALRLCQWGVTVLISLHTAIFFLRKDIYERMLTSEELTKEQYLPWNRYILGTIVLIIVALIFSLLTAFVGSRYRFYNSQLKTHAKSGVAVPDPPKMVRWLIFGLYFIFPALDIFIRFYIRIEIGLK